MTRETGVHYLKKIKRRYQFMRTAEIMLWAIATALIVFFFSRYILRTDLIAGLMAVIIGSIVGYVLCQRIHLLALNETQLAFYLNRRYPKLQDSADLLLKKQEDLSLLQQLQTPVTLQSLEEIYPTIKLPHEIGRALIALAVSIVVCILLTSFLEPRGSSESAENFSEIQQVEKQFLPPSIAASTIVVSPPAYTQMKSYSSTNFDVQLPEGSNVSWHITFDGPVSAASIILSARDTVPLVPSKNQYVIGQAFKESGFYQLTWKASDKTSQYSEFYKLDVIKDIAPVLQIIHPDQHLELSHNASKAINVTATMTDDHGLASATIVATVSKGSGEAVKFREEKLRFDKPDLISGKKLQATKTLDLAAFGLAPGDELYFYVEASDNKEPRANRTRTETYFIALQDTASMVNSVEASLGVDLMPEYFRSQRQIIIDSEKLLREKKQILKQNFNGRSNELGYDQKVLRLRYGEFLGEEFESSIGPQVANTNDDHDESIEKKFGHDHDSENEHNLVEEKKTNQSTHNHDDLKTADNKANVLEGFIHAHDDDEEATFFVQSIKAKLKAAVAIMWDAELYLRLYQPEKSLPYQYKALKLLKEISQDSRIYVHRTGFDPPPLKEERRLTGDLSEVKNSISKVQSDESQKKYPAIRKAIPLIESLIEDDSIRITEHSRKLLTDAGRELASLELRQPGRYLETLSFLNELLQDKLKGRQRKDILLKIRPILWSALPRESSTPAMESGVIHELDRKFLDNLGAKR